MGLGFGPVDDGGGTFVEGCVHLGFDDGDDIAAQILDAVDDGDEVFVAGHQDEHLDFGPGGAGHGHVKADDGVGDAAAVFDRSGGVEGEGGALDASGLGAGVSAALIVPIDVAYAKFAIVGDAGEFVLA